MAVEEHGGNLSKLVRYQEISGHFMFDVNLGENFRHKAMFVADGQKRDTPSLVLYSTIVLCELVRICPLLWL